MKEYVPLIVLVLVMLGSLYSLDFAYNYSYEVAFGNYITGAQVVEGTEPLCTPENGRYVCKYGGTANTKFQCNAQCAPKSEETVSCAGYGEIPSESQSCCGSYVQCNYGGCGGACYNSCPNAQCKAPEGAGCIGPNDCQSGVCEERVCKAAGTTYCDELFEDCDNSGGSGSSSGSSLQPCSSSAVADLYVTINSVEVVGDEVRTAILTPSKKNLDCSLKFSVGYLLNGNLIKTLPVELPSPAANFRYNFPTSMLIQGDNTLKIVADYDNQVKDPDRTNNAETKSFGFESGTASATGELCTPENGRYACRYGGTANTKFQCNARCVPGGIGGRSTATEAEGETTLSCSVGACAGECLRFDSSCEAQQDSTCCTVQQTTTPDTSKAEKCSYDKGEWVCKQNAQLKTNTKFQCNAICTGGEGDGSGVGKDADKPVGDAANLIVVKAVPVKASGNVYSASVVVKNEGGKLIDVSDRPQQLQGTKSGTAFINVDAKIRKSGKSGITVCTGKIVITRVVTAGETLSLDIPFRTTTGSECVLQRESYILDVVVDSDEVVIESDEHDNYESVAFSVEAGLSQKCASDVSIGFRTEDGMYCGSGRIMSAQKLGNSRCTNDFECLSNYCGSGEWCVERSALVRALCELKIMC